VGFGGREVCCGAQTIEVHWGDPSSLARLFRPGRGCFLNFGSLTRAAVAVGLNLA
jgi:hypothetical protein